MRVRREYSRKLHRLEQKLSIVRAAVADRPADDFQHRAAPVYGRLADGILARNEHDARLLVGLRVGGEDSEFHRRSGQRAGEFHDIGAGGEALHQGIERAIGLVGGEGGDFVRGGPVPEQFAHGAVEEVGALNSIGGQREFAGDAGLDVRLPPTGTDHARVIPTHPDSSAVKLQ